MISVSPMFFLFCATLGPGGEGKISLLHLFSSLVKPEGYQRPRCSLLRKPSVCSRLKHAGRWRPHPPACWAKVKQRFGGEITSFLPPFRCLPPGRRPGRRGKRQGAGWPSWCGIWLEFVVIDYRVRERQAGTYGGKRYNFLSNRLGVYSTRVFDAKQVRRRFKISLLKRAKGLLFVLFQTVQVFFFKG